MPLSFIFWLLMILWGIFGVWYGWTRDQRGPYVGAVLLFVLFFIIGWRVFGFVVQ